MMDAYTAVMTVEGEQEATEDEVLTAWQWLIDTGIVWTLQGKYGRTAVDLLDQGLCTLNDTSHRVPGNYDD